PRAGRAAPRHPARSPPHRRRAAPAPAGGPDWTSLGDTDSMNGWAELQGWTFYEIPARPEAVAVLLVPPGRSEPVRLPLAGMLPQYRHWFYSAVRSQLVPS